MVNFLLIYMLKPGKDPALSKCYRPISLLVKIVKLLEKILLTSFSCEFSERGLMRDEQFRLRPRQLARVVENVARN